MSAAAIRWRVAVAAGMIFRPSAANLWRATLYSDAISIPVGKTTVREVLRSLELDGFYVSHLSSSARFYAPFPHFDEQDRPRRPYGGRAARPLRRPFKGWDDARLQRYLELAEAYALACAECPERDQRWRLRYVDRLEREWLHRVEIMRHEIARRLR